MIPFKNGKTKTREMVQWLRHSFLESLDFTSISPPPHLSGVSQYPCVTSVGTKHAHGMQIFMPTKNVYT